MAQKLATPARRTAAGRRPRLRGDGPQASCRHGPLLGHRLRHRPDRSASRTGGHASDCRNRGIGTALVRHALTAARRHGHRAVILVGDAPYYGRFGFTADKTAALRMPGPFERQRLLALELVPDALKGARGLLRAPGVPASREGFAASAA